MLQIEPIPCRRDNYAYLVHPSGAEQAVVVDPTDAEPVLEALARSGKKLAAILNTHHHGDHVGGNSTLVRRFAGIPVYGHASDQGRIPEQTERLEDGARFEIAGLAFEVRHIPGHTLGAIAYLIADVVFTGDTLFVAGCGRLFEGTPGQLYRSLNEVLAALPGATRVYCGHEYTESNLRFAAHVDPDNAEVEAKIRRARARRAEGKPTVPSTIAEERATNPFLRCDDPSVRASVSARDGAPPEEVFAALRRMKDSF